MTTRKTTTGKLSILRVALYLRISQDRSGEGLGVARQEGDCRKLAEQIAARRGAVAHIEVFTDNDTSAYSGKKRKEYERMCEAIGRGEIDLVISWHPDRLHRSPLELEYFISLIQEQAIMVHTVQAGERDLTTDNGRMVARIEGAVARQESERKSARIKAARVQQAMAGKFHGGNRPYGYEPDGVTIREDEAREIVRMYEQVVAGVSLRQIVRDLNERGVPTAKTRGPWTSVAVGGVIKNPRNVGHSVHNGEVVAKAQWPALVSEETWQAAVGVLTNPARKTSPGNTPRWLGSGLYLCGVCGRAELRAGVAGSGRKPVYRCRSRETTGQGHVSRDAHQLDALVEETVVARLELPDAIAQLSAGHGEGGEDVAALRLEQAALRQRLDSLAEMFAAGEIDTRQLATASATLKAKISEIDMSLASLGMRSPLAELEGKDNIRAAWFGTKEDRSDGLSLGSRRAIVDMLLTVTVLPGPKGRPVGGRSFKPEYVGLEWKRTAAA
ncbi:recombinase family protein [Nocardia puris]|uniref:recombinase family protein n=1 Tax=Nocardia puris TaxID=208602 RepID=UPI00189350DC|nr:recombinase family protein [Nocardia puris]MBF6460281.1 recombinase family protein [Nocardia puris]